MIALILAAALAAPTDGTRPCFPNIDTIRARQALQKGVCPEICQLTASDINWLASLAFVCNGGFTTVYDETVRMAVLSWAGGQQISAHQEYRGIVEMCARQGCLIDAKAEESEVEE